ncbi:MAG: hypothetical protein HC796_11240 [Synechococcaceae cyanobacterium RL_1_2]|nr:hypothetical protein [Synechococcaceae cyanobacterium RL_1_2]
MVQIQGKNGYVYFVNNQLPLNNIGVGKVVLDKQYTYALLHPHIPMARTTGFLSPFEEKYRDYGAYSSIAATATAIMAQYPFPIILKPNRGSGGCNVFLCRDRDNLIHGLNTIFNLKDKNYDCVALAQELISIKREYRAIFVDQTLRLLYYKIESMPFSMAILAPSIGKGPRRKWWKTELCTNKFSN